MRELESFGCFEAVYDGVCPELKEALFGQAIGQLFVLPLETKRQNGSNKPHQGYIGQIPTMTYESLRVDGAPNLEKVEEFARLMWPQGDPNFWYCCHTVSSTHAIVVLIYQSLKAILRRLDTSGRLAKWAVRLSEFDI
ncbi:deoxypodophyllotoxin synthase-like [Elaeis guineensis]|uniref:deoxypodophyllotoxin synthase-like n=1 Tax=Elaeis guineensis var. tenera TaxID=51953 RepID=UPI003C6D4C3B